ncbi:AbgT family transporter [Parabacteroides sp. PF5-6]|uniref:YfcC family protein n=1 Tax=Parabacteroides sp. PF5-6 TaxID=1742403 RepID=UPI00240583AE|nr:AbgT family transporter [Parabacteroides sp. PF5-6]MDF9831674.1 putative ion transporter superfamily protein YfcC [Parabacteroides sp. PF5-6]
MKKRQIPHTYVIVFYIILFCALLTWFIPGGRYQETVDPAGNKVMVYETVESVPQSWQVFAALFDGFVERADIIVFILIIGGAFWIINDSKAFDIGIAGFLRRARRLESNRLIRRLGIENVLLVCIMLLFSLFGAVFGMSEETIAFCLVLVPLAISMGYDSITGVCMVFVAAGLGFAGAILNPFTIGIAQGLAGLPLFSGIEYRIVCWLVINAVGFAWILTYANKVKKNPRLSPVYEEDQYWRDLHGAASPEEAGHTPRVAWVSLLLVAVILLFFSVFYPSTDIRIGNTVFSDLPLVPVLSVLFVGVSVCCLRRTVHYYILNLLFFTIFFLIVGVMGYGWYIMEIATLFFALGLAAGLAAGRSPNELVKLFLDGCKDILSAAMVVGLAGGIIVILRNGMVIDTILHRLAGGMEGLGDVATVEVMYGIQTLINLVIPSGSAKAALTMPIMAPFSELIGLSKQATVMAFQFGDGFTNMITPTSGVLIAVLGVSRIPYDKWFRWAWKFILVLTLLGAILLIPTVLLSMNGF